VNSVAALQLALSGSCCDSVVRQLEATATDLDEWFEHYDDWCSATADALRQASTLVIVGRGPSLAAVHAGALVIKEAARVHAEGLSAAQFRHGPLELVNSEMSVLVLEGSGRAAELNRRLALELRRHTNVAWIGTQPPASARAIPTPRVAGDASRLVAEIVPLQTASVALASERSREPGIFTIASKVTTVQ
jgi:glucosamine--fructose-6-phosphate aminotransferase (isomerizing)